MINSSFIKDFIKVYPQIFMNKNINLLKNYEYKFVEKSSPLNLIANFDNTIFFSLLSLLSKSYKGHGDQ
jgi:hypothetical protein